MMYSGSFFSFSRLLSTADTFSTRHCFSFRAQLSVMRTVPHVRRSESSPTGVIEAVPEPEEEEEEAGEVSKTAETVALLKASSRTDSVQHTWVSTAGDVIKVPPQLVRLKKAVPFVHLKHAPELVHGEVVLLVVVVRVAVLEVGLFDHPLGLLNNEPHTVLVSTALLRIFYF